MTVKLTISYDGTDFCGWQRQKNGVSVQETVENALFAVTGDKIKIVGSGRTDAGVHAEGQVASFKTGKTIPPEKYAKALNTVLPQNVKIIKSELAPDGFDACRTAKKKTYEFRAYISDTVLPLLDRYSTRITDYPKIDFSKMESAARLFLGTHDFKAFSSSGNSSLTTVRTIYDIAAKKSGNEIVITVTGNGFLYNMVRIIAGVLVAVSKGEMEEDEVIKMLDTGVKPMKVKTLSARGLFLKSVEY